MTLHLRPYQRESIGRAVDHTGKRFSKWIVISFVGINSKGAARWLCRCECGIEKSVPAESLIRGKSKSCGCSSNLFRSSKLLAHGHARGGKMSGTYRSWHSMRQRCENVNIPQYCDYGGRGITVCERWSSFEDFFADMGERPDGLTLDRINCNGNYEPGNCRWATPKQQTNNRRIKVKNSDTYDLVLAAEAILNNQPLAREMLAAALQKFKDRKAIPKRRQLA